MVIAAPGARVAERLTARISGTEVGARGTVWAGRSRGRQSSEAIELDPVYQSGRQLKAVPVSVSTM